MTADSGAIFRATLSESLRPAGESRRSSALCLTGCFPSGSPLLPSGGGWGCYVNGVGCTSCGNVNVDGEVGVAQASACVLFNTTVSIYCDHHPPPNSPSLVPAQKYQPCEAAQICVGSHFPDTYSMIYTPACVWMSKEVHELPPHMFHLVV